MFVVLIEIVWCLRARRSSSGGSSSTSTSTSTFGLILVVLCSVDDWWVSILVWVIVMVDNYFVR